MWITGFIIALFQTRPSFDFNYKALTPSNSTTGFENSYRDIYTNINSSWISLDDPVKYTVIFLIIFIALILTILSIYISTRAEAGLIASVSEIDDGRSITFKRQWSLGGIKVFPVIGLKLLLDLPLFIVSIITLILGLYFIFTIAVPSMIYGDFSTAIPVILFTLLLCLVLFIMFIYSVFTSVIYTFASRKIILEDKRIVSSIKESWMFVKRNFFQIVVSFLVSFIITGPIGLAILMINGMVGLIVVLPLTIIILMLMKNIGLLIMLIIVLVLCIYFFSALTSTILVLFNSSYWTVVYKDIMKRR